MSNTDHSDDARKVLTIVEAGIALGLSRNGAYMAAARGEIPTIRIGKRLLVPKVAIERLLNAAFEPRI